MFRRTWWGTSPEDVFAEVGRLSPQPTLITLSGGNPALQPRGPLIRLGKAGDSRPENTQPFSRGSFVFAHNGTIDGLEELPESLGLFLGDTDSERYFALVHHHIREARDTITGIRKAVDWIEENCTSTSLNFLLADGDSLYALRFPKQEGLFVRRIKPEEDLRGLSSYGTRTEGHVPQGAVLFASERIDTAPTWRELEPGTLTVACRDLRLETHLVQPLG